MNPTKETVINWLTDKVFTGLPSGEADLSERQVMDMTTQVLGLVMDTFMNRFALKLIGETIGSHPRVPVWARPVIISAFEVLSEDVARAWRVKANERDRERWASRLRRDLKRARDSHDSDPADDAERSPPDPPLPDLPNRDTELALLRRMLRSARDQDLLPIRGCRAALQHVAAAMEENSKVIARLPELTADEVNRAHRDLNNIEGVNRRLRDRHAERRRGSAEEGQRQGEDILSAQERRVMDDSKQRLMSLYNRRLIDFVDACEATGQRSKKYGISSRIYAWVFDGLDPLSDPEDREGWHDWFDASGEDAAAIALSIVAFAVGILGGMAAEGLVNVVTGALTSVLPTPYPNLYVAASTIIPIVSFIGFGVGMLIRWRATRPGVRAASQIVTGLLGASLITSTLAYAAPYTLGTLLEWSAESWEYGLLLWLMGNLAMLPFVIIVIPLFNVLGGPAPEAKRDETQGSLIGKLSKLGGFEFPIDRPVSPLYRWRPGSKIRGIINTVVWVGLWIVSTMYFQLNAWSSNTALFFVLVSAILIPAELTGWFWTALYKDKAERKNMEQVQVNILGVAGANAIFWGFIFGIHVVMGFPVVQRFFDGTWLHWWYIPVLIAASIALHYSGKLLKRTDVQVAGYVAALLAMLVVWSNLSPSVEQYVEGESGQSAEHADKGEVEEHAEVTIERAKRLLGQ